MSDTKQTTVETFEAWWKRKRCPEHPHSHTTERSWAKTGYHAGFAARGAADIAAVEDGIESALKTGANVFDTIRVKIGALDGGE